MTNKELKFTYKIERDMNHTNMCFGPQSSAYHISVWRVHENGTEEILYDRYHHVATDGRGNTPEEHAVHLISLHKELRALLKDDSKYKQDCEYASMERSWAVEQCLRRARDKAYERLNVTIRKIKQ